jgi:protease I
VYFVNSSFAAMQVSLVNINAEKPDAIAMKKILIPLPSYGFDPTEVAIPWKLLTAAGFEIVFATPTGAKASPDRKMLTGENLGIWKPVLQARKDAITACVDMQSGEQFSKPKKYADIIETSFDGLLLPGGHDKGVKEYLESAILQIFLLPTSLLQRFAMVLF